MKHYSNIPIERLKAFDGEKINDLAYVGDVEKIGQVLSLSGLVDMDFYLSRYPDVAASGMDAVLHYVKHGWREGRMPNLWFDSAFYIQDNPDIAAAVTNPLLHYLCLGRREGRRPNPECPKFTTRTVLIITAADISLGNAIALIREAQNGKFRPDESIINFENTKKLDNYVDFSALLALGAQINGFGAEGAAAGVARILSRFSGDEVVILVNALAALPDSWFDDLYLAWLANRDDVIACRSGAAIFRDGYMEISGDLPPAETGERYIALPVMAQGVLLPPGLVRSMLDNKQIFDRYAPDYPDIWIAVQALLDKINVKTLYTSHHPEIRLQQSLTKLSDPGFNKQFSYAMCAFRNKIDHQYKINTTAQIFLNDMVNRFTELTHKALNISNCRTFSEKIQYLKFFDDHPLKTICTDKYNSRKYISKVIGPEYLVPLYGVWKTFDDINFDKLPDSFVLKANHSSQTNIIVMNKANFNKSEARKKFVKWLDSNLFEFGFELNYFNIEPLIICEKYLGHNIPDYKIFCFYSKPQYIWIDIDRSTDHKRNFYSTNWEFLNVSSEYPNFDYDVPKPKKLELMLQLASKLSKPFKHTRVDFYILPDESLLVGELTFYSGAGYLPFIPEEFDYELGSYLNLPNNI